MVSIIEGTVSIDTTCDNRLVYVTVKTSCLIICGQLVDGRGQWMLDKDLTHSGKTKVSIT